ncbi:MAG: 5-bromo-4-chloroindolyl phosphate hydrolysis family protein [Clostridia bacterium]|nr:5-bromo-4-chloroindolyl phosphate hydrolysis family protein [Clostridia bacterium]
MNNNPTKQKKKNDVGEWIPIAIMLMIPWLRIVGVILLISKAGRLLNLSRRQHVLIYLAAALILFGGVTEIFTSIGKVIIPLTAVVLAIIGYGAFVSGKNARLDNYAACIGDAASYPIDQLMSEMGVTIKKLRRDINQLKKINPLFKSAYIDEGHRLLVIRPEGKPAPEEPAKAKNAPREDDTGFSGSSEEEREYREILLQIRALNTAIDDEDVSGKIDRIEEITANIFQLIAQNPSRKAEIQVFMEYYLPTTLKLLRNYARLENQSAEGENIASSKARIESILNKLVAGFEKQLDILFKSDAVDITSDIKVLEKMMVMDGLTEK